MNAAERFNLTGKVAMVTGGARGIGRAIAIAMAQHGADVIVVDVASGDGLRPVKEDIQSLGRKCWAITHDLAQTQTLAKLVDDAWLLATRIDILVNNAAIA